MARKILRRSAVVGSLLGLALTAAPAANATTWTYYKGTDTVAGACKAWLNYSGHNVQLVVQSWGHNCVGYLTVYHNGKITHDINRPAPYAEQVTSGAYWDDSANGYHAFIATRDKTTGAYTSNDGSF